MAHGNPLISHITVNCFSRKFHKKTGVYRFMNIMKLFTDFYLSVAVSIAGDPIFTPLLFLGECFKPHFLSISSIAADDENSSSNVKSLCYNITTKLCTKEKKN